MLGAACSFAPFIHSSPDAGKVDGGVLPTQDGGARLDGGLTPTEACVVLNESRCAFLARCGLIENNATERQNCERSFEATWCGAMTWPSHVAAGALRFDPLKAASCAQAFLTQACGEWATLPDSCNRFLTPRADLGQPCYDGFSECLNGVCVGSSCPRTCQPRALLDDPCTADAECRSGLYCRFSPFMPLVGRCAAYGTSGSACDGASQCLEGLRCLMQQCRALPSAGSPCVEGACSDPAFCDGTVDAGVCLARKLEGATCTFGQCLATLVCDPLRAVCVKIKISSGDLCTLVQQCPVGETCVGASDRMAGLCHLPQSENAPCLSSADCQAHLACQNADGGWTCQRRAPTGSTCDMQQTCRVGAICETSTCTPLPLPGESCADTRACRWGLCRELANVDGGAVCGPLLSAAQPCMRPDECASGQCVGGTCVARCVP